MLLHIGLLRKERKGLAMMLLEEVTQAHALMEYVMDDTTGMMLFCLTIGEVGRGRSGVEMRWT